MCFLWSFWPLQPLWEALKAVKAVKARALMMSNLLSDPCIVIITFCPSWWSSISSRVRPIRDRVVVKSTSFLLKNRDRIRFVIRCLHRHHHFLPKLSYSDTIDKFRHKNFENRSIFRWDTLYFLWKTHFSLINYPFYRF